MNKQQVLLLNVCRHILGTVDVKHKKYVAPKEEPKTRLARLLALPGYADAFERLKKQVPELSAINVAPAGHFPAPLTP